MDKIVRDLIHHIILEGLTENLKMRLTAVLDTLLNVEDYDKAMVNVTSAQTLLLLLFDYNLEGFLRTMASELRGRLIRKSLGPCWQNGPEVMSYQITDMNRSVVVENSDITVYENGAIRKEVTSSIQPIIPKDELFMNDFGMMALKDY